MAEVKRGFGLLPCPKCGESEVSISVCLDELTHEEACRCCECDTVFGLADVRNLIAKWQPVLAWLDTAPVLE